MKTKLQEALDLNGQFNQDMAIIFGLVIFCGLVIFGVIKLYVFFKKGGQNELL